MNYQEDEGGALQSFSRPRYFYGQLLDVRHFESEQDYFKRKLWMLNRMVSGYRVVCGLDVQVGDENQTVVVTSGLALDKNGREIVVPCRSKPVLIEARPEQYPPDGGEQEGRENYKQYEDGYAEDWVHLVVCYREWKADPEPVMSGGCATDEARCSPGVVREGYELRVESGKAPEISMDCTIPDLIKGNSVNYRALADWVSSPCDEYSESCITLANIRSPAAGATLDLGDIDISVRPIVYSVDLLWELVLALTHETQSRRTGKN